MRAEAQNTPSMRIDFHKRHLILTLGAVLLLGLAFSVDNAARAVFTVPPTHWWYTIMKETSLLGKGWHLTIISACILGLGMLLKKKHLKETGELGLYALMIAGIAVQVVKYLIGRPRPHLVDQGITYWAPFLTGGSHGYDSFPSGHAAFAFALATVCARFFPRGRILFYTVASLIALSRLFVDAHFLSDVVGGAYLGLACGWVICWSAPRILQATSRIAEKRKDLLAAGAVLILAGVLFFNQLGDEGASQHLFELLFLYLLKSILIRATFAT